MRNLVVGLISVVVGIVLAFSTVYALVWHPTNSRIVGWDAVSAPKDDSGNVYNGNVYYQPYIKKEDGSALQKMGGEIVATQTTFVLPSRGKWIVGIKTVFYFSDLNNERVESERTAWSDVATDCANGQTFGILYITIDAPGGLKSQ